MKQLNMIHLVLLRFKPTVMQNHQDINVLGKVHHVLINHIHALISRQLMIVQDQLIVTGINQENVLHFHHVQIMMKLIVENVMDVNMLQELVHHLPVLHLQPKTIVMDKMLKLLNVHGQLMANANHYL